MNASNRNRINTEEETERGSYIDPSSPKHYRPATANITDRLAELELENSRLHRLVAELLIRNQQLRKPD